MIFFLFLRQWFFKPCSMEHSESPQKVMGTLVDGLHDFLLSTFTEIIPVLSVLHFQVFFFNIYLFMRDTQREAETQSEGEAGSLQRAGCGTWFQDPGIMTWTKSRHSTTEPPRCLCSWDLKVRSVLGIQARIGVCAFMVCELDNLGTFLAFSEPASLFVEWVN